MTFGFITGGFLLASGNKVLRKQKEEAANRFLFLYVSGLPQ